MNSTAAESDTIAAIATPPGVGGIAIVRISGPDSLAVADRVFSCRGPKPSKRPAGTFVHGRVRMPDNGAAGTGGRTVDEGLLLIMHAPRSYTGEDAVEIQGHGGGCVAGMALRAALAAGARPAEPGEFTRRAFLNGRIDLVQAEAVADVIHARSERAAASALEQLSGALSARFTEVYDAALAIDADVEAMLDFVEDELPPSFMAAAAARLAGVRAAVDALLATWDEGHQLRDGALVVISGRPNVGKSTLLNALLGRERSIVADLPGTTRDTIEEQFVLAGIPVRLVDTAGLRGSDDAVEREGVARASRLIAAADLQIYMVDASQTIDNQTITQLSALPAGAIVVLNKVDLEVVSDPPAACGQSILRTSLVTGEGLQALRQAMREALAGATEPAPRATIAERHRQILESVAADFRDASEHLRSDDESRLALAAADLRNALESLGALTGRVYHDALLDSVFSRFCVGK